ncbi:MAG: hypothetical protein ACJ79S_12215 [Gemmatimonadaceae bacterium]
MRLPETINFRWIDGLADDALLTAETSLHKKFSTLQAAERKKRGAEFQLMRGSAELLLAWDRWSRVSSAARERGLHLRRVR